MIYHKDIITDEALLLSDDDIPYDKFSNDEDDFPLKKEFVLKADMPDKCCATLDDFKEAFVSCYNELSEEKISHSWETGEAVLDKIYERRPECTSFIGGYPVFTQSDPRKCKNDLQGLDRVLFELDSLEGDGCCNYDIIWGDVGTGAFLISAEKLKNCDFSSVLYNYDCG